MWWIELGLAVVMAVLMALVLSAAIIPKAPGEGKRPAGPFLLLFLLLLLATWAGGVWLTPFGPTMMGVAWLPFVVFGLVMALLIAAIVPARAPSTPAQEREERAAAEAFGLAFGAIFWVVVLVFLGAVIANYAIG